MTQNPIQYFKVYANRELTRELTANDILDLTNTDNVLDLYITLNDYVSIDSQEQTCLALDGRHKVVLFDVVKIVQDNIFRDFSLVENIETKFYFNTKFVFENLIEKFKHDYFSMIYFLLERFSFERFEIGFINAYIEDNRLVSEYKRPRVGSNISDKLLQFVPSVNNTDTDFKMFNCYEYTNKQIMEKMEPNEEEIESIYEDKAEQPKGTLLEKLFNSDYLEQIMSDKKLRRLIVSQVLFYDGLFGKAYLNTIGNLSPTFYLLQDTFSNFAGVNASYYMSLSKYDIVARWSAYLSDSTKDVYIDRPYKEVKLDYNLATNFVGLGLTDTIKRYNDLYYSLKSLNGKTVYWLYSDNSNTNVLNISRIINSMTHSNGKLLFKEKQKIVVGENYQGSESDFFLSYNEFTKKYNINLDYIVYKNNNMVVGANSLTIFKSLISNASPNNKQITEFYDKDHPCPLDGISFYTPIPLTVNGVSVHECLYGVSGNIENLKFNNKFYIYKQKRIEDDEGNVTIKDLPEESYKIGTFKIPINKDEFVKYVSIPGSVHTFVSKDMVFHIKIKFKKTTNVKDQYAIRLFADDYTFGKLFYIKRGRI